MEDLKRLAMRQLNLEKAFNLRHTSFGRKDDLPTPRDLAEPIPAGPLAGWKMDERRYNRMLDEYYDCTAGTGKRVSQPVKPSLPWGSKTSPTTWKRSASWDEPTYDLIRSARIDYYTPRAHRRSLALQSCRHTFRVGIQALWRKPDRGPGQAPGFSDSRHRLSPA